MDHLITTAMLQRIRSVSARPIFLVGFVVLLIALVGVVGMVGLPLTAGIVVLNRPKPADVIVVAAANPYNTDLYYDHALQLLARHYAAHLVLPADATGDAGQTEADEAQTFIQATGGRLISKISVCPESPDEYQSLDRCLSRLHARTVLVVAPAADSRRSWMLYQERLPKYSWNVVAVADPAAFGNRWWSNRRWAKSYVVALQRLIYASLQH